MSMQRARIYRDFFSATTIAWLFAGCSVFDERLLEPEPAESDQRLAVADHLSCDAPLNESVNAYRTLDMSEYDNSLAVLPNCLGEVSAPGNDTFFGVEMQEGEKWHFHVQVTAESIDPVIYVLDNCSDSRSCRDTHWGINACGEGENEHFSFVPPASGRYYVGIDSLTSGGEPIQVFAVRAECGNLVKEHSEFCDDGNDDPLDGCHQCRPVLQGDGPEVEPNDGPLDPNLIRLTEGLGTIQITGALGGRCDFDFFQLEVPEDVRTTVSLSGVTECSRVDLQLRRPADPNPFSVLAVADAAEDCPIIDSSELSAGTYLVRVASRRQLGLHAGPLDYAIEINLEPLEP